MGNSKFLKNCTEFEPLIKQTFRVIINFKKIYFKQEKIFDDLHILGNVAKEKRKKENYLLKILSAIFIILLLRIVKY